MDVRRRSRTTQIWIALCAVYVIWGSTYLAIRVAIETLPPLLMASVRFLVAGGLLYAWAIRRGRAAADRPGRRQWGAAAVVGGALLLGGNGGVVLAEQRISSGLAALLVSTVLLWMALVGWIFFRERLPGVAVAGLVIGFAGTALLVGPSDGARGTDLVGSLLVVGAALSWAAGSLYARSASLPRRPMVATSMEMLCGGALLGITGLLRGELAQVDLGAVSARSALALGYLIVFGALAGFSAYRWLLGVTRTSLVSTYAYVNPVVAVFLGWLILNEPVTPRTIAGGAIVVIAVALIVTARHVPGPASPADVPPAVEDA